MIRCYGDGNIVEFAPLWELSTYIYYQYYTTGFSKTQQIYANSEGKF